MKEYTYVMLKPDGFKKASSVLVDFYNACNDKNLSIQTASIIKLDDKFCSEHYSHLVGKDFYPHLVEFMTSGYVFPMMVYGENAISKVREIIGATNPNKALPGTIRAMYGDKEDITYNVIHASDSQENAKAELDRVNRYIENYKVRKLDK